MGQNHLIKFLAASGAETRATDYDSAESIRSEAFASANEADASSHSSSSDLEASAVQNEDMQSEALLPGISP